VNNWPGREAAEALRLWSTLQAVVERAEGSAAYDAVLLLGSLARGDADEFSDIDLLLVVKDGHWESVWSQRHAFSDDSLYRWDETYPMRETGKHGWLTKAFVMVELGQSTRVGGHLLADPYVVLAGDPEAARKMPRLSSLSRNDLRAYVAKKEAAGEVDEVQQRMDALVTALRSSS
jgi:hypothetical protein